MPIIRIFRATIRPGKVEAFREFFLTDAISILRGHDGFMSVQVGLPTEETPREFMMTTVWRDLEALKGFAGESWREAYIAPEEAPLVERAVVDHYELAEV